MRSFLMLTGLIVCLISCKKSGESIGSEFSETHPNVEVDSNLPASESTIEYSKAFNEIEYSFQLVSGREFLERSQQIVSTLDSGEESNVLILTLKNTNSKMKGIKGCKETQLPEDELQTYLTGSICSDMEITTKDDKKIIPLGSLFEGRIGDPNSIRVYFFVKCKISIIKSIQFYDRVYGNGIIKKKIV